MFAVPDRKFALGPGQLSKLLNPKSLDAFYALGGIFGLEKGPRTNRSAGVSLDETNVDGFVALEDVKPIPNSRASQPLRRLVNLRKRSPAGLTQYFVPGKA